MFYCAFTFAGDVMTGGLSSEAQIRNQLEDKDPQVKMCAVKVVIMAMVGG